jgi:hypothetical protein
MSNSTHRAEGERYAFIHTMQFNSTFSLFLLNKLTIFIDNKN